MPTYPGADGHHSFWCRCCVNWIVPPLFWFMPRAAQKSSLCVVGGDGQRGASACLDCQGGDPMSAFDIGCVDMTQGRQPVVLF